MRWAVLPAPHCSHGRQYQNTPQKRLGHPVGQQGHAGFGHRRTFHERHHLTKASLLAKRAHLNFYRGGQIQAASQHSVTFYSG